jgi:tetratricopeptide (TPR) repeat protein
MCVAIRVLFGLGVLLGWALWPALAQTQPTPSPEATDHWQALIAQVEELYDQGRYAEAVPLAQEALALAEASVGPTHPHVATSLQHLARLNRELGRYAEAEPLLQRALTIREQILGPAHPEVATSLNELAVLYWAQGRYAEAEPFGQRALIIREQAFGPKHSAVGESLNDLAVCSARSRSGSRPSVPSIQKSPKLSITSPRFTRTRGSMPRRSPFSSAP